MIAYLQKPAVQLTLFLIAVAVAGAFFYFQGEGRIGGTPAKPPPAGFGQASAEKIEVGRRDLKGSETAESNRLDKLVLPPLRPEPPTIIKEKEKPREEKKKAPTFPDLVQVKSRQSMKPFEATAPDVFAPRGTLIKAALVITLESNTVGTPVLGMVTEDLYFQGNLIVPAGTMVQATSYIASGATDTKDVPKDGKVRDRIDVRGQFRFVWADGSEYVINGIALDAEPLPDGTFALTDGSPGIRGRILKTDDYAELKILISEALQGYAKTQQTQYQSVYGLVPDNTQQNAALGGGISGAAAYSNILSKKLAQDLEYVQVPAGTSFYIYTLDVFEPELRSIGGLKQGNQPKSGLDLQQASYAQTATRLAAEAAQEVDAAKAQVEESNLIQAIGSRQQQQQFQQSLLDRTRSLLGPTAPPGSTPLSRNLSTPTAPAQQ
jgi:hypothetical protein